MAESELLKKVAGDVSLLMTKMNVIEQTMNEIDHDLHRDVNPAYLRKLERIQKQKGRKFKTIADMDKYLKQKAGVE
ncbi:MAG: hypothetical protein ABIG84_03805 [archaeon]